MRNRLFFFMYFLSVLILPAMCFAQADDTYGSILSIAEKTVSVNFKNKLVNVGEEVEFRRISQMVDPVSGDIRGSREQYVGRGVVDEIGVGKVQVTIIELEPGQIIQMTDKVLTTGVEKIIIRREIVGFIKKRKDDGKVLIDLGSDDAISEGDEFLIKRLETEVDPVTNEIKVIRQVEVGKGRAGSVDGSSTVADIVELLPGMELRDTDNFIFDRSESTDRAITTESGEKMVQKTQIASIRKVEEDGNFVIDLGVDDEVSEGDEFLIQRFETTYDPETKLMTSKRAVDIGKGRVNSVDVETSVGSMIELLPGRKLLDTDTIVYTKLEKDETAELVEIANNPSIVETMRQEIDDLKQKVSILKATVDSLGNEQLMFRSEIESVIPQLMAGDIRGTRILIKNDEPITRKESRVVFETYKKALDTCFRRDYKGAIGQFNTFMKTYPESKLTENCLYWIAQSYYNMGYLETAVEGFKAVIDERRFKHKDDDASIMAGITYYKLGKQAEAVSEFRKFIMNYPSSEYRSKVDNWIKRLSS